MLKLFVHLNFYTLLQTLVEIYKKELDHCDRKWAIFH